MKQIILFFFIIVTISETSVAQKDIRNAYEQITYSVVNIENEFIEKTSNDSIGKIKKTSGTGFLTLYKDFHFLITARHIAEKISSNSKIYFSNRNRLPYIIKFGDLINFEPAKWTYNKESDVAIHLISPTQEYLDSLKILYINPVGMQKDKSPPKRDEDLTILGFPLGLGIHNFFSPISKTTQAASDLVKLRRPEINKYYIYFLLSDPSISGFSGAPLFLMPKTYWEGSTKYTRSGVKFVGLVSATISDNTGGKFAAVVPSYLVFESLQKARNFTLNFNFKYSNGKQWQGLYYKNGKPWTVIYNYAPNGNPQEKGSLKNGNGTLYNYDRNGKLIFIENFKDGVQIPL